MSDLNANFITDVFSISCFQSLLSLDEISRIDIGIADNGGPEAGKWVGVVDFNDMELLQNTTIKTQLLLLELREDDISEVLADDHLESLLSLKIAFM